MSNGWWSKTKARDRLADDEKVQQLLTRDPQLRQIVCKACRQRNVSGYNRVRSYVALKQAVLDCGYCCGSMIFRTIIPTLIDLLPPDDIDRGKDGIRGWRDLPGRFPDSPSLPPRKLKGIMFAEAIQQAEEAYAEAAADATVLAHPLAKATLVKPNGVR